MACLPVSGHNPRALAGGLSYVHVDKHGITILYHLPQCRPCITIYIVLKMEKGGIIQFHMHSYLKAWTLLFSCCFNKSNKARNIKPYFPQK